MTTFSTSLRPERRDVWFQRAGIFLVFLLALGVRLYWVSQKTGFHGDELTSLSIVWDGVDGQGNLMHDAHRVYTSDELRHFFTDETGGWNGLKQDLNALWHDNQDVPHASLYYMLLRCALTAVTQPSPEAVIWWGCALNLLFFTVSFFTAARLLCERSGRRMWPVFALALAYLNSIAVSNALFLREYALAEMAVVVLAYCVLHLYDRIGDGRPLFRPLTLLGTVGAVALALSSGYVNTLLVALWAVWLTVRAYRCDRLRTAAVSLCTVGVLSVAACWAAYQGFFNYVLDPRIERTSEKLQTYSFFAELWMTVKGTARLLILRVLTPVGTVLAVVGLLLGTGVGYLVIRLVPTSTPDSWWCLMLCGAIAISAMILPGISGSFVLLLLGQYYTVLRAITWEGFDLRVIFWFGLGCLAGLGSIAHLLSWLFRRFRDMTTAVMIGFMLGSLIRLWPWQQAVDSVTVGGELRVLASRMVFPEQYGMEFWSCLLLMAVGAGITVGIELLARRH